MGNSYGGWFTPNTPKRDGTTLVELTIKSIYDAHAIVSERPDHAFTPVTLQPTSSMATCCCVPLFFVSIPEGFAAIVTKFSAVVEGDEKDGSWSAGYHCFCNPFFVVDKLVSKQLIVFDTPVKDCKTKDAITVNLDVLIVFEITKPRDFVYGIGAQKLDDLLRAAQDEALRQMAMETNVEDIYDLSGSNTQHIIDEMNETKFNKFGVHIHHFTVKNVSIPHEMAQDFEDKTLFDSQTTMQHTKQKFDRQRLNNSEGQEKLREECENARMAADQQTEVEKNQAIKVTAEVIAQTSKGIAELEAKRDVEARQVMTNAELDVSKTKSKILAMEREFRSRTQADCGRLAANADAYAKKMETDVKIEVAGKVANGKRALGEAEGEASAAFAARRAFQAELKRLDIFEQMVLKGDARIATTQENTMAMSEDNMVVTQVAQQGLEALRAKLSEVTATSLTKLAEHRPSQARMR